MNKGKAMRKSSRDNRDIFGVFKKDSFLASASFGEKFNWWLKNVFVPHLAFKTAVFIIVAVLATMLVIDIVSDDTNDLDYIIGGEIFADSEQMDELSGYIAKIVAEDGEEISIGDQMLCTESMESAGGDVLFPDEYAVANRQKIEITFSDDEILLFFLDKQQVEAWSEMGAFSELSEFGIESENKYFVRVDETPVFKKLGILHKDGIYAAIKMKNKTRSEDERILEKYEKTGRALAGILAGK